MSEQSKIEWTDHTWNPWEGCTKVSPGCLNCYAEARNKRFHNGANWGKGKPRRRMSAANWELPLRWNRKYETCSSLYPDACANGHRLNLGAQRTIGHSVCPARYRDGKFVGDSVPECGAEMLENVTLHRPRIFPSLCDWLDDEVPIEWLADFLKLMHDTPNLDWLLLTKRPENFEERIDCAVEHSHGEGWQSMWTQGDPPANVWIGASVEDQKRADERIPELLKIPAKVRFLSCEPLLGPLDLTRYLMAYRSDTRIPYEPLNKEIHWLILGGESGPGSRPCNVDWIASLVSQRKSAGVPCFVKQLGSKPFEREFSHHGSEDSDGMTVHDSRLQIKHRKGGDPAEWEPDLQVREFPKV